GELEAKRDHAGALAAFQRARELSPDDAARPLAAARCFQALGRSQEALDTLRQNLKAHPEHGGSWLLLGQLYTDGGYAREAVDAYRKAVGSADLTPPQRIEAMTRLGFACAEVDLVADAIQALERAIEMAPDRPLTKAK